VDSEDVFSTFVMVGIMILAGLSRLFDDEWRLGNLIRMGKKKEELDQIQKGIHAIAEADPSFELTSFCQRMLHGFQAMQNAKDVGELARIRAFCSDGIYQRLCFWRDEQRELGRTRKSQDLKIQVKLVEAHAAKNEKNAIEVISLLFFGTAKRTHITKKGEAEHTEEKVEKVYETWTFLRRRGAKTKQGDFGLISGQCPNCGTDVTVNEWEKCPSCESMLRSGEHDWVLSKISDQSQWKPQKPFRMSSATRYWIQQDPGFSAHYLEDRASVIFYRKLLADRSGNTAPLAKVATDRFCETYDQLLTPDDNGERTVFIEPKILVAEVAGVIAQAPFDFALMRICWTSRVATITKDGRVLLRAKPKKAQTMLVLARRTGVRTRVERTITSSHCPTCGAPESNQASHSCEFCHTVLNDGELEWTLYDMLPYSSTDALGLRKQAHEGIETRVTIVDSPGEEDSPAERVVVLEQELPEVTRSEIEGVEINGAAPAFRVREDDTTLIRLLRTESRLLGLTMQQRRDFLHSTAKLLNVSSEQFRTAIQDRLPVPNSVTENLSSVVLKRWLTAMVDVAYLDQRMEPWELDLIRATAKRLGLSAYDVNQMVRIRRNQWNEWTAGLAASDMIAWVIAMVAVDGEISEDEKRYVDTIAEKYSISPEEVEVLCQSALEDRLVLPTSGDCKLDLFWYHRMTDAALADGKVVRAERRFLLRIGNGIGLSDYDVQQTIRRRKAALYREANEKARKRPRKRTDEDDLFVQTDW